MLSSEQVTTGILLRRYGCLLPPWVNFCREMSEEPTKNTEQEKIIDGLCIGRAENGSRDTVFKLKTKEAVSVNRVTEISMLEDLIESINKMGLQDNQLDRIEFSDYDGNITLLYVLVKYVEDDSNASEKSFKFDD